MRSAQPEHDDPYDAAHALFRFGYMIRQVGRIALLASLVNIAGLVISLYEVRQDQYSRLFFPSESIFLLCLIATILAIMAVAFAESLRKRGDAVFEELSDDIQWGVGRETTRSPDGSDSPPPPRELRVALRQFAMASDLPLIPGRAGPGLYSVLNILVMTATVAVLGLVDS